MMKLLFLDIETTPNDAWVWGIWQQNVSLSQLKEATRMMCWAASWEGDKHVYWNGENRADRYAMVKEIYDMVDAADAVCHYNGTGFDMKHLNREFAFVGLPPPTPYRNIDLLKVVKKNFKLPSYKMAYVLEYFGLTPKVQHAGFELWEKAMAGDRQAWRTMEEYNIGDIDSLEELYYFLQGWIKNHPNRGLWLEDQDKPVCRNCGSTKIVKRGIERPATVNAYQRYKCKSCGANLRGRTIVSKLNPEALV